MTKLEFCILSVVFIMGWVASNHAFGLATRLVLWMAEKLHRKRPEVFVWWVKKFINSEGFCPFGRYVSTKLILIEGKPLLMRTWELSQHVREQMAKEKEDASDE